MAQVKAEKDLYFIRDEGEVKIRKGQTFTPDKTMDVDTMLKSGKVSEVKRE